MAVVVERPIGREKVIIETGKLAEQAHGAVTVRYGDTVILATVVMADKPRGDIDFLPLTIEYEERLYAAGKIPGSFFRREGRPTSESILSARLTDRSIRPLFPKGLHNEIQVIITVLSADPVNPPEIIGMLGVSAALSISQIPFEGPIGASRIAYRDGEFIVHPTYQEDTDSQLSMVVTSTRDAIIMVESGSDEVSEEIILEGIRRAHEANQVAIDLVDELTSKVGKPKQQVKVDTSESDRLTAAMRDILSGRLASILDENTDKVSREDSLDELEAEVAEQMGEEYEDQKIAEGFKSLLKEEVRRRILEQSVRPDGRALDQIRPISCEVGLIPRTHGSGLFTRGQTQVLSIATLASLSMKQSLDTVGPDGSKLFMHHYNFPPYSTGETRRVGSPGRREIGHGALAERAVQSVIPPESDFPYAIRVVSEVLSSNGSTSMGSVCGTTLALMDAGVPIKAPVAGIAMGLITGEEGKFAILSDIQGMEDFLGDMDFKVAGTAQGVNALQMDIKIKGLAPDILRQSLEQARVGRLFILDKMLQAIDQPRSEISQYAPRMVRLQIPVEKIGALIGPGGRTIRGIIEETGATIDVADDGGVTIGGADHTMLERARSKVESLTRELAVGDIFTGKVTRTVNFGVFVELLPGRDGLLRNEEMGDLEEEVKVGQELTVVIQEIDAQGRLNLSRRALFGDSENGTPRPATPRPMDRGRPRQGSGGFSGGGRGPSGGGDRGRRPGGPDRRFQGGGGGYRQ